MSDELRRMQGGWLNHRRAVSGLSLLASAAMGVVSAYQVGLMRRPPEPRWSRLDAEAVDASGEAYWLGHTPDVALALYLRRLGGVVGGQGITSSGSRTRPLFAALDREIR